MRMPPEIPEQMIATCGMDCMVCYRHCNAKKPCPGCCALDEEKPLHCRKCGIRACADANGYACCWDCAAFPCQRIRRLDKSYQKRYGESLIENGRNLKAQGTACFLKTEQKKWSCQDCGGVISLHDQACSECGAKKNEEDLTAAKGNG